MNPWYLDATSLSTRTIYLCILPIFCECCHVITLVFLFSNFILKFYLKNPATMCGVSPSIWKNKQTGLLVFHFPFLLKKEWLWFSWLANNFLWTKSQNSTVVRNHLHWHVSSKIFLFRESLIPYNLTCMLPLRPTLFSLRLRWVIRCLLLKFLHNSSRSTSSTCYVEWVIREQMIATLNDQ